MRSTPQSASRRCRRRGGFTLTEMLVVIGIIILVLSVATPMVTRAWRAGDRARMAADLHAISTALEAYKQDHGNYPQVARAPDRFWEDGFDGARMLCRALIAPGPESHTDVKYIPDGKGADVQTATAAFQPGPGFRTRGRTGQVYGPYLKLDQFKVANPGPAGAIDYPGQWALLDRYNRPILYYVAVGKPNIRLAKSYAWDRSTADKPLYNALDNWNPAGRGGMPKEMLALMLGDLDRDGQIDSAPGTAADETPAYEGPYLLWSAGPDEIFGLPQGALPTSPPPAPDTIRKAIEKSDDITNFRD